MKNHYAKCCDNFRKNDKTPVYAVENNNVSADSNNNGRNGSFLRGWLPHRGKAQMACNYSFPARKMF